MAQESGKTRYSIALASDLASLLKKQAVTEGKSLSAFLAQIIEEHYAERKTLADYEREIAALQASSKEALQLQRADTKNKSKISVLKAQASCSGCATNTRKRLRNLLLSMMLI